MRLALEDLLSVPDEAPEVDGQLYACLTTLANLIAQHPQVLLKLHTAGRSQRPDAQCHGGLHRLAAMSC